MFDQKKLSLKMASKETYVASPPFQNLAFSMPGTTRIRPAPDIEHLTPPGCHLCIGNHVCMLTFTRFGKFRLWF